MCIKHPALPKCLLYYISLNLLPGGFVVTKGPASLEGMGQKSHAAASCRLPEMGKGGGGGQCLCKQIQV